MIGTIEWAGLRPGWRDRGLRCPCTMIGTIVMCSPPNPKEAAVDKSLD